MNVIGCLDQPTSGIVRSAREDVSRFNDDRLAEVRNHRIGFVFQNFNLLAGTDVVANVELPLIYSGTRRFPSGESGPWPRLEAVGLSERVHHRPTNCPGGSSNASRAPRVGAVNDPRIILADEPTGNLDSKAGAEIMGIFQRLNVEQGITVILVTHEPDIAEHCRRNVQLYDGKVRSDEEIQNPRMAGELGVPKPAWPAERLLAMDMIEELRLALRALSVNKLRSAVTMLGIIIGVGAVITLLSVGQGVQNLITDQAAEHRHEPALRRLGQPDPGPYPAARGAHTDAERQ